MDEQLWKAENYGEFLVARRKLLASATNEFLDKLWDGRFEKPTVADPDSTKIESARPISVTSDEEEAILHEAIAWMKSKDLPTGELGYELTDSYSGREYILDLTWPRGIQTDRSEPVALLIDEDVDTLRAAQHVFNCLKSLAELKAYVKREILGETA